MRPGVDFCRPVYERLDGRSEEALFLGCMGRGVADSLPGIVPALVGAQVGNTTQNPFRDAEVRGGVAAASHLLQLGQAEVRHGRERLSASRMAEVVLVHAVDVWTALDGSGWRVGKGGGRGRREIGAGGETA